MEAIDEFVLRMEEVASEDKDLRDAMAKLAGFMRRGKRPSAWTR